MKKRVLSATLAIAMLASSVGAMNVFAANSDAYVGITFDALNVSDLSKIYLGTYEDAMEEEKLDDTKIYLFDYKPAEGDKDDTSYDDVIAAIEDAVAENDTKYDGQGEYYKTAVDTLKKYLFDGNTSKKIAEAELDDDNGTYTMSDTREAILKLFDVQKDIADNFDPTMYYAEELYGDNGYNVYKEKTPDTLVDDLANADRSESNSELLNMAIQGDRIFGLLGVASSWEERYNERLEDVSSWPESDFTAANYRTVQRIIEDAEYEVEDGTEAAYKKGYEKLAEAYDVTAVAVKYADLRDALEGLFKTGGVPAYDSTKTYNEYPNTYYDIDEYIDADDDAWYDFAGRRASSADRNYVEGAFRAAMKIYDKCRLSSTRRDLRQSQVDKALEDLNNALLNLTAEEGTKNWVIVKLEDALDAANAVVEDDYRTTSSVYRDFLEQVERVENMLDAQYVNATTASDAADKLMKLIDDIRDSARKTVPVATKNDLDDLVDEAEDLLDDAKAGKTSTQISNLETAIDEAKKVRRNSKALISEYENATAELQSAVDAFNQKQGWYQENGTWYYGKEDTVAKGWLNVNGVWYLLDDTTGAMKTGWQQVNGTWYYLNASGAMQTGWLNLNGTYYYLESWGGMATGWKNVNGSWYYLQSSGAMVANGWYWINGKCYYFYNWGGMAANTTINGWTVGADGAWIQ
mgnify:CR=1 FL=1